MDRGRFSLGDSFQFYRLFFNSIAVRTLIPVLWYAHSLRQEAILRWEGAWLVSRYLLLASGILLVVAGGRHYSLGQFLGIGQLRAQASREPPFVRHRSRTGRSRGGARQRTCPAPASRAREPECPGTAYSP